MMATFSICVGSAMVDNVVIYKWTEVEEDFIGMY
jgi:hypothetical protein